MQLITKSAFGRMIGVSPQMVDKIQDRLTLISGKGKKPKVDLHGADTIAYLREREEKGLQQSEPLVEPEQHVEISEPAKTKTGNNHSGLARVHIGGKRELEEEKIKQQIEKLEIENKQKRGALISKDLVIYVFSRLAHIDENQFKALNIRVCPKINAAISEQNELKSMEILALIGKKDDQNIKSEVIKILNAGESERDIAITQILEDDIGSVLRNIQATFAEFLEKTELEASA